MNTIGVIMSVRFLSGSYCNNNFSRREAAIGKIYCLLICTLISINVVQFIFKIGNINALVFIITLCEYIVQCLVSIKNGEKFYRFYNSLKSIVATSGVRVLDVPVTKKSFIFFIIIKNIEIAAACWFYNNSSMECFAVMTNNWVFVNYLMVYMVFELMWSQMISVKNAFEHISVDFRCADATYYETSRKAVRQSLLAYKCSMDALKHTYSLKVSIIANNVLYMSSETLIVFGWHILASCINSEYDKVKQILQMKLLFCTDDSLQASLEDALTYLTIRPFKYSIWRLFNMDAPSVLGLLGAVTTYLIIQIQFSHMLD